MNRWLGALLVALVVLSGCSKKFSDIFDRGGATALMVNDAEFEYLSSKAKIDFDSDASSVSGTANIRIQKDSILWISLSPGLGIEAARVLATTDSVSIIDKINKTYSTYSFRELSQKLDFEVTYHLLESVVLGNLMYPYDREKVVKNANTYVYRQQQGSFAFENIIGAVSMKLEKIQLMDTLSENTISVNYSDFQLVDEEVLPFRIQAMLTYAQKSKGPVNVNIEYKQTEIEKKPLKFPYNIPQRYERK